MKFKRAGTKTNSCIVFSTLMYMTVQQFLVEVQWLAESAHERGRGFDSWIFSGEHL